MFGQSESEKWLKTKPTSFELVPRGGGARRGEFYRIIDTDDTTFAVNGDLLISTKDPNGLSDRPHEREVMPLSQVQL